MALALNRFQTETKQLTTADQTIYTAPNGYTGIVLYAHVTNYGSSATTVTMSAAHNVSSQTVGFFHPNNSTGRGGLEMDASDLIPAGMTIYGRWTSLNLSEGRVIAYFGK